MAGVFRAVAIDGVDPADGSFGIERMVAVAIADAAGDPVTIEIKAPVAAYLESLRGVNFVVNAIDPTYQIVDVTATIVVADGENEAAVVAAAN